MKRKNKKISCLTFLLATVAVTYGLLLLQRPVEIIAVHQEDNLSDVLVRRFPFTINGKINWWLKNKNMLKEKYAIPKPASYGGFTIAFWHFGNGYKEEGKYDRLCFNDMKTRRNCIEKDYALTISYSNNMGTTFTVDDGVYRISSSGAVIKISSD